MRLDYFDPTIAAPNDIGHMLDSIVRRFLKLFRLEHPEDDPGVRKFEHSHGRHLDCEVDCIL